MDKNTSWAALPQNVLKQKECLDEYWRLCSSVAAMLLSPCLEVAANIYQSFSIGCLFSRLGSVLSFLATKLLHLFYTPQIYFKMLSHLYYSVNKYIYTS